MTDPKTPPAADFDLVDEVNRGIQQLDEGRAAPFDDAMLERIKLEGRARLRANPKSSNDK